MVEVFTSIIGDVAPKLNGWKVGVLFENNCGVEGDQVALFDPE